MISGESSVKVSKYCDYVARNKSSREIVTRGGKTNERDVLSKRSPRDMTSLMFFVMME